MDFYQTFKDLISAQSAWQISLAITLGLINGFLPEFSIINVFILLIVLVINIPLHLFIFFTGFFFSIEYLLSELLSKLGENILMNNNFHNIFQKLYDNDIFILMNLNHTTTIANLIIVLIISIPFFLIIKNQLIKNREKLSNKFAESKYFKWLNPYTEENIKEKPKTFRIYTIIFLTILISLIIFFNELILQYGIIFALEKTYKNKIIKLEKVETNLLVKKIDKTFLTSIDLDTKIRLINLKIIDKKETKLFKEIIIDLNTKELINKHVDIKLLSITNLIISKTINSIDIKNELEKKKNDNNESINFNEILKIDEIKKIEVEDILAKENLKSVEEFKRIKINLKKLNDKYQIELNSIDSKKLEKDTKNIINKIENVKTLKELQKLLKDMKLILNEIKNNKNHLIKIKKDFINDKKQIQKDIKNLEKLKNEDYDRLKNKYTLDENGLTNIIDTYISKDLAKYFSLSSKYYKKIQPYIDNNNSSNENDEEKIILDKYGKYVHFNNKRINSKYLIENLNIKITNKILNEKFEIHINNLTNEQRKLNKMIVKDNKNIYLFNDKQLLKDIKITNGYLLLNKNNQNIKIDISHNLLNPLKIKTNFVINLKDFKYQNYNLENQLIFKDNNIDINGNIDILNYKDLNGIIDINVKETNIIGKNETINKLLKNINHFSLKINIDGNIENPSINIENGLTTEINKLLKNSFNVNKEKYQKDLKNKLNKEYSKNIKDLNINSVNNIINEKLSLNENLNEIIKSKNTKKLIKKFQKDLINKNIKDNKKIKELKDNLKNKFKSFKF
jgi:uncharacterized protein (TIGR03545 family)/uncharacterized protein (TIGR03546 family)